MWWNSPLKSVSISTDVVYQRPSKFCMVDLISPVTCLVCADIVVNSVFYSPHFCVCLLELRQNNQLTWWHASLSLSPIQVKLRCGLKNEATDVDEPSRCEWVSLSLSLSLSRMLAVHALATNVILLRQIWSIAIYPSSLCRRKAQDTFSYSDWSFNVFYPALELSMVFSFCSPMSSMVLIIVTNVWQELQDKLDLMNKEQPLGHDEL